MSFLCLIRPASLAVASQTPPRAALTRGCVLWRELVPVLAMRSRAPCGGGSGGRIRVVGSPFRSHVGKVVGLRAKKKVIRPAAPRHVALVQNTKLAGILAGFQPPNEPRDPVLGGAKIDAPISTSVL